MCADLAAEYRATLDKLLEKERALVQALEGEPSHQRRYELGLVREMIRDSRAALRQLRPRGRAPARKFVSLEGQSWQWAEKQRWDRLESSGRDNRARLSWMRAVLDDGTAEMTGRQRQVFELLYREGMAAPAAAEKFGVSVSTIYRTARRAVEKLRRYAEGRELVRTCVREDGSVDLRRVVAETAFLTQRQRQALLLTLDGLNQRRVAETMGVNRSTAGRTLRRGERRLKKLTRYLNARELRAIRNERIQRASLNWRKSCKELAAEYGVSLWLIYKLTANTRRWEGMTALQYDIWQRKEGGQTPKEIAAALGTDVKNIYQALVRIQKKRAGPRAGIQRGGLAENSCLQSKVFPPGR
ncbi:sigma-70 family RNA polymerase sigma factor [Pseudoflavonifractor sp. 524-17]|uniref:sigma factor-like helix-turn-helix DNA-binding protein n=1 Tax=Pseudoflavonifractor sp. 524-17 TaxID=2304577 RepID=UPI00137B3520|nr:sigma factor-like helix-turn-helix DNA-binding protein [Pseudoflavonifractor sp. 524-17]NCE65031.1 sigma-70 family RNA polymerase sigma factor [Pseudoflavonifractor sp. 524-17]